MILYSSLKKAKLYKWRTECGCKELGMGMGRTVGVAICI